MQRWLISWIGNNDVDAEAAGRQGPIASALPAGHDYNRVVLLNNLPEAQGRAYTAWLARQAPVEIEMRQIALSSPINYGEIYERVSELLAELDLPHPAVQLTFHLSPGTPAMIAIWIILAKTRFAARLIQTSQQRGLESCDFLFDLASDFLPEYLRRRSDHIVLRQAALEAPPEFAAIIHDSEIMRRQITLARRMAAHDVPILVLGQTGTGKELFAKAMHAASARRRNPFIPVNCGAISRELANSELFGHKRGAFTGADRDHKGYFGAAHGGTLFLDEIGDLALDSQVRLLRVLQEKEYTPVGDTQQAKVDVRIIAATHKNLQAEVAAGRFRQDLFQRLAVGVLQIPSLCERGDDMKLLIAHFMEKINNESTGMPEFQHKILLPAAYAALLQYGWPGNIRELYGTLFRAAVWSASAEIDEADVRAAFLVTEPAPTDGVMEHPLGEHFSLQKLLDQVEREYIGRALEASPNNRTAAAELLGYSNYQTLNRRIQTLDILSGEN